MQNILSLAVFAGLVALAASFGAHFEPGAWYASLAKPAWTPPNAVFPVAWGILYIMIALAGWLVWRACARSAAMMLWGVGLVLNGLWSYVFFGQHQIGWAFINIMALWLVIVGFITSSWNLERRAAYLFLPYLAWVSFALALNAETWRLNG